MVRGLDKIAMSLSAMALAFESLVERVAESPSDQFIDADDVLYAMLAAQEARLRKTSTELLAYWQPLNVGFSQRRAAVRLAALRVGEASQAVAVAARNLRGTIQAHDANVSALQQARRVCRTPAEPGEAQPTSHAENRHPVPV